MHLSIDAALRILCLLPRPAVAAIIAAFLAATAWVPPGAGQSRDESPLDDALAAAEDHFENGRYQQSRDALKDPSQAKGALPGESLNRYLLLQARLAAVHDEPAAMRGWLERLATHDPETALNPYTDPPQLLNAWQEALAATEQAGKHSPAPGGKLDKSGVGAVATPGKDPAPTESGRQLRGQTSGIVSLLPFGIGSYHTGAFSRGLLFTLADLSIAYLGVNGELPLQDRYSDGKSDNANVGVVAAAMFGGSWGYQMLLTEQERPSAARPGVMSVLSYFPLGVGQLKNGQPQKALGFALSQSALFALSAGSKDEDLSAIALWGALGSLAFGAYDGWYHHRDAAGETAIQAAVVEPWLFAGPARRTERDGLPPLGAGLRLRVVF